jgi:hypothetical protein
VSPSRELAMQTGEAAQAICSRLGLTVSLQVPLVVYPPVQVGCMVWWFRPLVSWLCRPVRRPGPSAPGWGSQSLNRYRRLFTLLSSRLYCVVVSPSRELAV